MRNSFKKLSKFVVSFFFLFFVSTGFASLALANDFSADMVSKFGNETTQGKISVSGDKMRMEMPEGSMIIRKDLNVSWMLMKSEKMYMENPLDLSRMNRTSQHFDNEISRTSLGQEAVNGQAAEKFKIVYKENGKEESVYQWIGTQGIPVKTEAIDGSWSTVYSNISLSALPADLFEIPAGFEKMEMPSISGMLGNMMGR